MNTLIRSAALDAWLKALRDLKGRARIVSRLEAMERGNFGDCESVGEGVSEMRIHCGPGYRVYFTRRGRTIYVLLKVATNLRSSGTSRLPWKWCASWRTEHGKGEICTVRCR